VAAAALEPRSDWSPQQVLVDSGTLDNLVDYLTDLLSEVQQRLGAFETGLVWAIF
jgi:hypothetical protein